MYLESDNKLIIFNWFKPYMQNNNKIPALSQNVNKTKLEIDEKKRTIEFIIKSDFEFEANQTYFERSNYL